MIEKKRYSTKNCVQYSGLHKAQSALEKRKTPCTLQWKVHPGEIQPYMNNNFLKFQSIWCCFWPPSKLVFSDLKIQMIPENAEREKISTHFSMFLFLNNFLAKIGWPGVIAEVQTVV